MHSQNESSSPHTFISMYESKPVNAEGFINYTDEEHRTWQRLILKQEPIVKKLACAEYIEGLELLNFPKNRIPQCDEVSNLLLEQTGWQLYPVPSLIPNTLFFELLATRKFPAATFIRRENDFGYVPEPDIFHEIFGHCPLLTNKAYADFAQKYGELCLTASPEDQEMLARIYWYTFECGLIETEKGLRAYGGSILSSSSETIYALESKIPQLKPFDLLEVLRTPYRIDILQPIYFVIKDFDVLFNLLDMDLKKSFNDAREMGIYSLQDIVNSK